MALVGWSLSTILNRRFISVSNRHAEIYSIVHQNSVTKLFPVVCNGSHELSTYRMQKFTPDRFVHGFVPPLSSTHDQRPSFGLQDIN